MFKLPDLSYGYNALEPYIDKQTMRIHHNKHHGAYVKNLNSVLEKYPELENKTIDEMLAQLNQIPENIRTAVQNNGGGHANHSMFWTVMKPNGGGEPQGNIANAIKNTFGSVDALKEKVNEAGLAQFGSGWAWLIVSEGKLDVSATPNQDSPLSADRTPILCIDVWEHAYYLAYQNKRADYLKAWWNVVNWEEVSRRYEETISL